MRKLAILSLLTIGFFSPLWAQSCVNGDNPRCMQQQTITTSGQTVQIASNGGMSVAFEYVIKGSPTTMSTVLSGCMWGGTCSVLNTSSSTATTIVSPTLTMPYNYYTITSTFSGGTSVSLQINAIMTTARAVRKGYGFVKFYYPATVSSGNQTDYQPPFPVAATALGATVTLQTPPVACTTYASVSIYNSTQSKIVATATLASGTNSYTMTINNASISAGDVLLYQVGTSASGCTTNAGGIQLDMTYSYLS